MPTNGHLYLDEGGNLVDQTLYHSMIGSLLYLTASRPDIMFSVCMCARFEANPKKAHLHAVKRILRYLKHTPSVGLWYPKGATFDFVGVSNPGGSLDRRVNCRRVPQPRWVGARRSAKGGRSRRETGIKGETRGLRVCPAPRSGALAVGGYKRPRGREREAYASAVPSFSARPTLCKRALDLPFIGVRRGSSCTMGGVAVC
jgi:hypothetical protein